MRKKKKMSVAIKVVTAVLCAFCVISIYGGFSMTKSVYAACYDNIDTTLVYATGSADTRTGVYKAQYTENGRTTTEWCYLVNGVVQYQYTGLAQNSNGWWYCRNGKVDFKYNDFVFYKNNWWYCRNGRVDFGCDEVIKGTINGHTDWWYASRGVFQDGYSGFASNSNGTWLIVHGKVDFYYNGLFKDNGNWWVIKSGKVQFDYKDFYLYKNDWWYCKNGKVDFVKSDVLYGKVNGIKGWWFVQNGKVIFRDTVEKNKSGWWIIRQGQVDFDYTGLAQNSCGWWYIKQGKVDFSKEGIVDGGHYGPSGKWYVKNGQLQHNNSVEKDEHGEWWFCIDGRVRTDFTGIAPNKNGLWFCIDGRVDFSIQGLVKAKSYDYNKDKWWFLKNGRVQVIDSVEMYNNAWWCIHEGVVDFDFTGFEKNKNGWWYCQNGKVRFDLTAIAYAEVGGKYDSWYVKNGKIQTGFSGRINTSDYDIEIKSGKVANVKIKNEKAADIKYKWRPVKTTSGDKKTAYISKLYNYSKDWKKADAVSYYDPGEISEKFSVTYLDDNRQYLCDYNNDDGTVDNESYLYNAKGDLLRSVSRDGSITENTYSNGVCTKSKQSYSDYNGNKMSTNTTYKYDKNGKLIESKSIDSAGNTYVCEYAYDKKGNETYVLGKNNGVKQIEIKYDGLVYDSSNRIIKKKCQIKSYDGYGTFDYESNYIYEYTYYGNGVIKENKSKDSDSGWVETKRYNMFGIETEDVREMGDYWSDVSTLLYIIK